MYLLKYKSGVITREEEKEYPWQVPWILVNKVYSKVCEFSNFHNKWKTDIWRDDKNVKIVTNIENNDSLQTDF